MTTTRRLGAFELGQGLEPPAPSHTCAECGYASNNRKNFRRSDDGEGHTCSTGHYEDKEGNLKRQKNLYARR